MVKLNNVIRSTENLFVNDVNEAKSILKNINWNFYQRDIFPLSQPPPFDCRKHHWFPATFVPEIPYTLIEVLTKPKAVVYDPFAGIGTAYFQALLLSRKPLATEICRVAVEYMQSLFILFDPEINFEDLNKGILQILKDFNPQVDYVSNTPNNVLIDKLKPWYSEKTLNQLSFLFIKEANCSNKAMKAAMRISISSILRTASSQDRGWGCIADNVLPKKEQIEDKDVMHLFEKRINALLRDVAEHLKYVDSEYRQIYNDLKKRQTIFYEDIKACKEVPDNYVDLVVTSPPYPNMTDYVNSQRLSYYFYGFDLTADRNLEIGARSKRSKADAIDCYMYEMREAVEKISRKIKSGGYACYVMPIFNEDDKVRERVIHRIISCIDEYDLIKEGEYDRILPTIRRSHNIKWATLERERIYLFRKL